MQIQGIHTFFFFVLVLSCQTQRADKKKNDISTSHLKITNDGAWCWFSDPRAVFYHGQYRRTYMSWVDSKGNIVAAAYDYDQKTIDSDTVHPLLESDDHDNPSIWISEEGKIHLFYSKHSSSEPIIFLKSKNPEDIHNWEPGRDLALNDSNLLENASNTYTYTNVLFLSDENKLYLFWRGLDFKPNFSFSGDGGESWTKGSILILPERIYSNRRPYVKYAGNGIDAIHVAFTDGHPRDEPTNSIYYFKYSNDTIYSANGKRICALDEAPVSPAQSDLVYSAKISNERAWIWDVAADENADPVIVYVRFPDNRHHMYCYARWDGSKWINQTLVDGGGWFPDTPENTMEKEPNYSGGLVLDHSNPSIVYLSVKRNDCFEIEKWTTRNNGESWKVESVTANSDFDQIRPFVVRNHPVGEGPVVLWLEKYHYTHYTDYHTAILAE